MSKPYDIALSMGTYFDTYKHVPAGYRRRLYNDCIESLRRVDWLGLKVVLIVRDDHSAEPPDLKELSQLPIACDYEQQPVKKNGFDNLHDAVMASTRLARWVIWLDDDSLVAPDILPRAFWLIHKFPNAPAYGLFNSPLCPDIERHKDYALKERLTELGTMFRGDQLTSFKGGFWINLANGCLPRSWPCLRPSVIQHTGRFGENNREGIDDYDKEF